MLLLGLGGGTLLALLASLYRGAEFRAVELDAAVIEAAKRYLGLSEAVVSPASLTCGDAVEFVRHRVAEVRGAPEKFPRRVREGSDDKARHDRQPYDVILVDAFGSDNMRADAHAHHRTHSPQPLPRRASGVWGDSAVTRPR